MSHLQQQESAFFDKYFWDKEDHKQQAKNKRDSNITVCPFLHESKDFYWKKAYLDHLQHQFKLASSAEVIMTDVFLLGNAFNITAPVITNIWAWASPLIKIASIVGIVWNMIDSIGALILAYREAKNDDWWAAAFNILSAIQLMLGTIGFALLTYGILSLGIMSSVIAASLSGFSFAAAMFFSWALEHREGKLHEARMAYLLLKIQALELAADISNYPSAAEDNEKINFLKNFLENSVDNEEHRDLLKLLEFIQHQRQQLANHQHARRVWGFCAGTMTAVAIVAVLVIELGISTSPLGIAIVAIASLAAYFAALHRNKPIKCVKTENENTQVTTSSASAATTWSGCKNSVTGFFKRKEEGCSPSGLPKEEAAIDQLVVRDLGRPRAA